MTAFDLVAAFLAVIGVAGWINARYLHLPTATIMVLAGLCSGGVLLAGAGVLPTPNFATKLIETIGGLNFPQTVLRYMLGLLLFAGAMQVNLAELRRRIVAVFTLATAGVLVSTALVGGGLWLTGQALGLPLTLPWALVFGTLISPTDPIAVLAAVKQGGLSKSLEAVLQGEALLNDGVGIVLFTAAVAVAAGGEAHPLEALGSVGAEAVGGLLLGAAAGWVVVSGMRAIDDYAVEVGLSLALAVGAYALAGALHLSGPIAVVAAGLVVGDRGFKTAMSDLTQPYVRGFWTLVDEILNALLFLLLGLELLVIPLELRWAGLWLAAIGLVLAARFLVVLPWGTYFRRHEQVRGASLLLGWGGLHGALSLALALSLPEEPARGLILSTTFAVVLVSVLLQGLTFGPLAARLSGRTASETSQ
jgi:CPA1 family monovalent cation:H+ antiporter